MLSINRRTPGLSLFALLTFCATAIPLSAQQTPRSLWLDANLGTGFYIGEFSSLDDFDAFNPGLGSDFSLGFTYAFTSKFAIAAEVGRQNFLHGINDYVRARYASNFFGPAGAATYPGSAVAITEDNSIGVSRYLLRLQFTMPFSETWGSFATAGFGTIHFQAANDDDQSLPENLTGSYDHQSLVFPIGGGATYNINEVLTANARLMLYLTTSDYLDGYAHYLDYELNPGAIVGPGTNATPADHMLALTLGISWKIYQGATEPAPPVATSNPPSSGGRDGRDGRDGSDGRDGTDGRTDQPHSTEPPTPQPRQTEAEQRRAEAQQRDSISMAVRHRDSIAQARMNDPQAAAAPDADPDRDGLTNQQEQRDYRTRDRNRDTDGDALTDGEEVETYHTNPNEADSDRDGLVDGAEIYSYKTDPNNADSDGDGVSDGDEIFQQRSNPLGPNGSDSGAAP